MEEHPAAAASATTPTRLPYLAGQIRIALTQARFVVDHAADGEEAMFLGTTEPYDAIVLDLGLPVMDGLSVLRGWRKANCNTPVLILTARDSWSEKVTGLNAGADDYLATPFAMDELLARLHALIRRATGHARPEIIVGPLLMDVLAGAASWHGPPSSSRHWNSGGAGIGKAVMGTGWAEV
jgi:two-component system OmpR family response regulator